MENARASDIRRLDTQPCAEIVGLKEIEMNLTHETARIEAMRVQAAEDYAKNLKAAVLDFRTDVEGHSLMGVDAKPLHVIFMAKCETRDTELKTLDLERETALAKKKSINSEEE